jgi:hypothetical protein
MRLWPILEFISPEPPHTVTQIWCVIRQAASSPVVDCITSTTSSSNTQFPPHYYQPPPIPSTCYDYASSTSIIPASTTIPTLGETHFKQPIADIPIVMTDPGSATTELDTQLQQSHTDESPQRHATLKKKNSVKRSASKRSKVDTIGSTTLSPTSNHDEPRNDITRSPLWCPVPTNADPTVVLSARFQGCS